MRRQDDAPEVWRGGTVGGEGPCHEYGGVFRRRMARARGSRASCGDKKWACGGHCELGKFGNMWQACFGEVNEKWWSKWWVLGGRSPVEAGRDHRIHRKAIVVFAIAHQRAVGCVVDVTFGYRPAVGRVHDLQSFLPRPVPDLERVAESSGDGNQTACLGKDDVTGDEKVTRTLLHLHVEACLESCLEDARALRGKAVDSDGLVSVLACDDV